MGERSCAEIMEKDKINSVLYFCKTLWVDNDFVYVIRCVEIMNETMIDGHMQVWFVKWIIVEVLI